MNLFSPSETSDIVASVIAVRGASVVVCGSCCDWDCCGALGCSWPKRGTPCGRTSPTNSEIASRVVITVHIEVRYPTNCRTNGCRATPKAFGAALQFDRSQAKRIHDNRNRAEAHRSTGNHRAQEQTKERIKHTSGNGHPQRVVDKCEK